MPSAFHTVNVSLKGVDLEGEFGAALQRIISERAVAAYKKVILPALLKKVPVRSGALRKAITVAARPTGDGIQLISTAAHWAPLKFRGRIDGAKNLDGLVQTLWKKKADVFWKEVDVQSIIKAMFEQGMRAVATKSGWKQVANYGTS